MSQIGWIDFSPDDRNKVSNVLALLAEPGTLDELGIGQIRDAYSDALFPGISTIQTRAKYFITIPRIIRDYQQLNLSRRKHGLPSYLKERENEVARVLAEVHGEDEIGIIGRTRIKSGGVDRRPSVIYWNGLRTLGIIKTQLSLADYCRHIDAAASNAELKLAEIAEGSDDKDAQHDADLIRLPDIKNHWLTPDELCLDLSRKEAAFLKEKMLAMPALEHAVLVQLFRHDLSDKALDLETANREIAFELMAELLLRSGKVDAQCRNNVQLANEFSLAIEGPHIRYNILLARNHNFDDNVQQYEADYQQWLDKVRDRQLFQSDSAARWLSVFGAVGANAVKKLSRDFVFEFCRLLHTNAAPGELDKLVAKQAKANKGARSLLNKKLPNSDWVGMRRLDYRWSTARQILQDIRGGLHA